jgi:hypothetical protein
MQATDGAMKSFNVSAERIVDIVVIGEGGERWRLLVLISGGGVPEKCCEELN